MRFTCIAFSLATCVTLTSSTTIPRDDGKKSVFFNGKDLEGWTGLKEYWSVKDGAIVGDTAATKGLKFNTFLCSKKTYKDFELNCQVRLKNGDGNSGVQIRSKLIDSKQMVVSGPQCDIGNIFWGSLYGERFGGMMKQAKPETVKKTIKPKDFNDYYIKCVGKHVNIKINGTTMIDDDFPMLPEEGIIAFQLHAGGPMEVTYKDIQFKDLSSK